MISLVLVFLVCARGVGGSILASNAATWSGRTLSSPSNVTFSWEGVQASFTVSGATSITLLASTRSLFPCMFHTLVDGALYSNWTLPVSNNTVNITIAEGLQPASHSIVVWAQTDPLVPHLGWNLVPFSHSFYSFATDDGGVFGLSPPKPSRRLQFIGDSITAGKSIDPVTCETDHMGSYGARLCQQFDADCQTLAIGGKGLYENCCDNDVTMAELFTRTIAGYPDIVWDDSSFVPDGVILALGTNDQGRNNGPAWVASFTTTYAAFLQRLTLIHNNSELHIFCAIGPITHDYYPWVEAAIAASGVKNAQIINFTAPVDKCNHPSWASHDVMAQQAYPVIGAALGWVD